MKGHFYKPHCKCPGKKTKKCSCGASWSYMLDVGINPQTGKRKQKKKGGFQTKGDAEKAAALLLSDLEQGSYMEETNDTFKEFADKWLKYYSSTGYRKESTIITRRTSMRKLNEYLGGYKLKNINLEIYQKALVDIMNSPGFKNETMSRGSVVVIHSTGSMIFRWAVENKKIRTNPTEYAYVPKVNQTLEELESEEVQHKYFEKEELSLFLDKAKLYGEKTHLAFLILAYTGMRVGELCALKWKDIDLDDGTILINRNIFFTGNTGTYKLTTPKTKQSKREITIEEELVEDLRKYKAIQNEFKMNYRNIYHDEDFVIAKGKGDSRKYYGYPEQSYQLRKQMKKILKMSKINKKLTPHSLRHTHTSLLAEAGASLEEIMDRLGHTNDITTRTIYLHVTKTKKREASQKFHSLMKNINKIQPNVTQMLPFDQSVT